MSACALVIGIDKYRHKEWNLTGAVRDAVAFADWAVEAGGVDPANLTLLLSPLGEMKNAKRATRRAILQAFHQLEKGAARDFDRLWFYYAGHGLAPPGQDPAAGPLIVPADVDDIDFYVNQEPVGLEVFRGAMQNVPPGNQFYFVDACRDAIAIKDKLLSQMLLWDVRGIDDDRLSTQALFLGTTAGQKAKEVRGHGLFGRALLAALKGLGPNLLPGPPTPGEAARRRLVFDDLVEFVREAVRRGLDELPDLAPTDRKGIPYARVNRLQGDILVRDFGAEEVPRAKIGALVDPARARQSGRIEFLRIDDDGVWGPSANPAPVVAPLPEEAVFEIRGGKHYVRVTANGFEEVVREILVYEDKRIPFELHPLPASRSVPGDRVELPGLEAAVAPPRTGNLVVTCPDPKARVAIYAGSAGPLQWGYGAVSQVGLSPGPYRVSAELTATERVEQTVVLRGGGTQRISLDVATPRSAAMEAILRAHDIPLEDDYAKFPGQLGAVANLRLGSLLAYAAWAARWPSPVHSLHDVGVDRLRRLPPEGSAVQVLVGDVSGGESVLAGCRVQIEGRKTAMKLVALPKLPAVQGSASPPSGPIRTRVEMPGFAPASFASTLLPGYITVLIITREADGDIDVQQHLNPVDVNRQLGPGFAPPQSDDVRLVELAWRALEAGDALDDIEYVDLLHGKRSNPMLAVIAGYRMFRTPRADRFRHPALHNMLRYFPGLPDVHVLAGLYEPENRAAHFQRAMDTGTPVLAEGYWALTEWLAEEAIAAHLPAPLPQENVLPGLAWTAFTERPRAAGMNDLRLVGTSGRTYVGNTADSAVLTVAAQSVALLEVPSSAWPGWEQRASTFLIAPALVLCPVHVARGFAMENADGTWTLTRNVRICFDPNEAASDRGVKRVVRTLRPDHPDPDGGSIDRQLLDDCWPVLLELDAAASAPPMKIGKAPTAGQRVAIIGFPHAPVYASDPSSYQTFAQRFAGASGEKHAMPGTVVRAPGESWTLDYDCFTAGGTSGGPVVNTQDGTVVGMHVVGLYESDWGAAIALSRFAGQLP